MDLHNANEFPLQHAEEHLKTKIQSARNITLQYEDDCCALWMADGTRAFSSFLHWNLSVKQ